MEAPYLVVLILLAIADVFPLYARGSFSKIKNEGVTSIFILSQAEELLAAGAKISSSRNGHDYGVVNYNNGINFPKLLEEAELVHSRLDPIMRSLYFRIFRINLDAPCRLRERSDVCASGNDDATKFSVDKGIGDGKETKECVPKCYVGRCHPYEFSGYSSFNGLEHFVARYHNEPKHEERDPKELYSNNLWYKDILGFYPDREEVPIYVDLLHNPPSYTAYKGGDDWKEIYDLQCANEEDIPCDQTEHLYRLISGMQSSVTAWSAWNHKCINSVEAYQLKTEIPRYLSNPDFFYEHLGNYPDRLENLFYTFQAMLKTVCRLQPFLDGFANKLGDQKEHAQLKHNLLSFLGAAQDMCRDMKTDDHTHLCDEGCQPCCAMNPKMKLQHPSLLERFNKISDLVDCLGCEKCRLHGKLKLTALQIAVRAFGSCDQLMLERNEIVALLHAIDYFAQSIIFVHKFNEQRKRQRVIYPTRVFVAVVLIIIMMYRAELRQAFCRCTAAENQNEEDEDS